MKKDLKKYSKIATVATLVPMALTIGLSVQKNVEVHAAQTSSAVVDSKSKKPPKPTVNFIFSEQKTITGRGLPKSKIFVCIDALNQAPTFVVKTDKKGNWSLDVPNDIKLSYPMSVMAYQIGGNGQYSDVVDVRVSQWWC